MSDSPKDSTAATQAAPFDARADAIDRNMQRRLATSAGSAVGVAVPNGATSIVVTFARREFDTKYAVSLTPSWATTVRVAPADKAVTGFTARFGSAAGASATVDYLTYRAG